MLMPELNDFFNDGFGWVCRHCDRELKNPIESDSQHSRLLSEGETENKQTQFSNPALAKWADPAHRYLVCPRCGITELADIS